MATDLHSALPENDYVSPGLITIMPDAAFPNMIVGDTSVPRWPYLRRWVEHNWYTDQRYPDAGFADRDEASILYNSAALFRGKPCLEVGCWLGWSAVHLALGSGMLDIIDPVFDDPDFADSITASCKAAGVLDKVTFHAGFSPGAIDTLAQSTGKRWSLIFIDADHEGDAPRLDAEAAMRYATDTAMVLFHDLASPYVAAGLDAMRNAGWRTMIYQTMQIMGVAWRGNVEPVAHVPDPKVFWTLPRHLSGYQVSGWKPPALPADGSAWVGMTMEDRRNAAMMRAQAAEDDIATRVAQRDATLERAQAAENALATGLAERDAALARAQVAENALASALAERDARLAHSQAAENALATGLAERDAMLACAQAAKSALTIGLAERDTMLARAQAAENTLATGLAQIRGQLAELTAAIARKQEAEAVQASAFDQDAALHRLLQSVLRRRVLLGLLRRSPEQRIAMVHGEAAALGIADIITDPFVHWLCQRRILIGLLRRPARLGEVAVLGVFRAAQKASPDEKALAAQFLPVPLEAAQSAAMTEHKDGDRTLVEQSGLFDAAYHLSKYPDLAGVDLLGHYLEHGWQEGRSPGPGFDGRWYLSRNPDVARSGENPLLHYLRHGAREGREPIPRAAFHARPGLVDSRRENVIVVVHETSRTGAPILGWNIAQQLAQTYNVYTVRLGDGALTPEFEALSAEVHGPFIGDCHHPADIEFRLRPLFAGRVFKYAIVNSIESRPLIEVCARHFVPTLLLMHEFGSYVRPLDSLRKAFDLATEIVFPAPVVARSAMNAHPALSDRHIHIETQGMSIVPAGKTKKKPPASAQMNFLSQARAEGTFIVMGAGSVTLRKGVDLFIAVAADVQRLGLDRSVHFLWVGGGYRPNEDMGYSVYLKEQLERSGLEKHVTFMEEVSDLEPVYALAHAFLLTSRLDPLPNVSIDAAHRGIPIICFKDASGTADLMLANNDTAIGVVAHLDTGAAADLIGSLASDEPARMRMADATGRLARTIFDMKRYVERLDALGTASSARVAQQRADAETLSPVDSLVSDITL